MKERDEKMRKTRIVAFLLTAILMSSLLAVLLSAADYSVCFNNTLYADAVASISDTGLLTVSNRFIGFQGVTTCAVITTYVEKRILLFFWTRVDIGVSGNEWVDYVFDFTYIGGHTVQLDSRGTYRVTSVYEVYGSGGPADVITCQPVVQY
ncbi:MAG: hypothetical protein ACOYIA_00930 [Eubacteriales bacterium]|jgi:hypothetical protein